MNSAMRKRIRIRQRFARFICSFNLFVVCIMTVLLGIAIKFDLWPVTLLMAAWLVYEITRFVKSWTALEDANEAVRGIPND